MRLYSEAMRHLLRTVGIPQVRRGGAALLRGGAPPPRAPRISPSTNLPYDSCQQKTAVSIVAHLAHRETPHWQVRLQPENPTYLINRAAAALMLQRAEDALTGDVHVHGPPDVQIAYFRTISDADSNRAADLAPDLIKARVRGAKALVQLGRLSDARRLLELAGSLFRAAGTLLSIAHVPVLGHAA